MASLPQYYSLLPTATADEIRAAYKRESLKTHPDRLPAGATQQERRRATERFQAVADAYYVLSDPSRRAEYDALFRSRPASDFMDDSASEAEQEKASSSFFDNFASFFQNATGAGAAAGGAGAGGAGAGGAGAHPRPNADNVFGDVFEDLLAPEVAHVKPWWSWLGGGSGAVIGYIVANVPGAVAGGFAGNRLGAIRDAKGKSVASVFATLPGAKKAEVSFSGTRLGADKQILRALAFKVLGSMQ